MRLIACPEAADCTSNSQVSLMAGAPNRNEAVYPRIPTKGVVDVIPKLSGCNLVSRNRISNEDMYEASFPPLQWIKSDAEHIL
jgi:hypothetical protein